MSPCRPTGSRVRRLGVPLAAALLTALPALWPSGPALGKDKIQVGKLDDLPRHTYPVEGNASDLLRSPKAFAEMAAALDRDLRAVLEDYAIPDPATEKRMLMTLHTLAFLDGNAAEARRTAEAARKLEEKESARLTMGLLADAVFTAAGDGPVDLSSAAFRERVRAEYAKRIEALPWSVVQDQLEGMKGQVEILSENLIVGLVQAQVDPAVEKAGFLSGDQAEQLVNLTGALRFVVPLKDEISGVLAETIAARRVAKEDIWAARNLEWTGAEGYSRVRIGVWDTGVDLALFPGQVLQNSGERSDGEDNDGNGFIDDVSGIAYDSKHAKTPELLYPLGSSDSRRTELENRMKGFFDLQAALDTQEAADLRKQLSGLPPEAMGEFLEELTLYSYHCHGTHVAGIALAGNPYAEVSTARLGLDHHMIPPVPTLEDARGFAREVQETVRWFQAAGVRVVNMSWVLSVKEIEADLEKNGVGKNAEERGKMAREQFAVMKEGLLAAFESAPEILFVGGAGNSDNNVSFDEFIPPAFDLPNLLIAGAVDQAGDPTGFTSFGPSVEIYSNGFEVDSFVPGGRRMKLSGTSMASPNVVNLAAKLLAMDPKLTPAEVVALIRDGATVREKDPKIPVMNPKRSAELLAARMPGSTGRSGAEPK